MASVRFEEAAKRFDDVVALDDFSLEVLDGEFVVFVGPSGSGKTTALRLAAGLERLTSGHIHIGERVVDDVGPRDRDIAMVFQDYALYPQMSVFDNLAFGLRMRKIPKGEIGERVSRAADMLGIADLLRRKPRQLSGGQRQRVAVGRALVREPHVFLMDEPLSNLDAKLRAQMRGDIRRLQQEIGTTTIYVTHDQVEAMTMGDRIVVMSDGVVRQIGAPDEVYESPADTFVAGFIGSPAMAFARLSATPSNGHLALSRAAMSVRAPASRPLPSEVTLGVRSEHARVWNGEGDLHGPFEGRIAFVEALGRETLIGVDVDDETQFTVELEGLARPKLGESIRFGFEHGRGYLFDARDGRAVGRM
jgi:ABC-type sugar transport system ATPase subunit